MKLEGSYEERIELTHPAPRARSGFCALDIDAGVMQCSTKAYEGGGTVLACENKIPRCFGRIGLSDQQMKVVTLVGVGLEATEIAEHLKVSRESVYTHLKRARVKIEKMMLRLPAADKEELIAWARKAAELRSEPDPTGCARSGRPLRIAEIGKSMNVRGSGRCHAAREDEKPSQVSAGRLAANDLENLRQRHQIEQNSKAKADAETASYYNRVLVLKGGGSIEEMRGLTFRGPAPWGARRLVLGARARIVKGLAESSRASRSHGVEVLVRIEDPVVLRTCSDVLQRSFRRLDDKVYKAVRAGAAEELRTAVNDRLAPLKEGHAVVARTKGAGQSKVTRLKPVQVHTKTEVKARPRLKTIRGTVVWVDPGGKTVEIATESGIQRRPVEAVEIRKRGVGWETEDISIAMAGDYVKWKNGRLKIIRSVGEAHVIFPDTTAA